MASGSIAALIKLSKEGQLDEALRAVGLMIKTGVHLSPSIFYTLLQACISKANLTYGREVHRLIARSGLESNIFLRSHLIRMFASCGSLSEANHVFNKMENPNVFVWSAIISANASLGQGEHAIKLYHQMRQSSLKPDGHIFAAALKACASIAALREGRRIETHINESDCESNIIVGNALLDMYAKCRSVDDACRVFDRLPKHDLVTWNTMIAGHVQCGHTQQAFCLFKQMQKKGIEPDQFTFVNILKACVCPAGQNQGHLIHSCIVQSGFELNLFVGNSLINMYAMCGFLKEARKVFDSLTKGVVVTWNAMISGYILHENGQEALQLFILMQTNGLKPNHVTFVCIIKACSSTALLEQGKLIHTSIIASSLDLDVSIGNSLIDMYAKCGCLWEASRVFEKSPKKDVVTWNAMLTGNAQNGRNRRAFELFQQMQEKGMQPNQVTFVCMLKVCISTAAIDQGLRVHAHVVEAGFDGDMMVGNSLIDMYAKCGNLMDARQVFDNLLDRDVVTWNTMITGYGHHLHWQEALLLFQRMQVDGMEADRLTFLSILKACASISALDQGKLIHAHIIENGFESDAVFKSTLIHLYAKCGDLTNASWLFRSLSRRDLVMWNAMIAGYAEHSNYNLVQQSFKDMQTEGVQPDDVTFVSLLSACSRLGLVDDGCHCFKSMQHDYGILPTHDHYNCMVDLLGRAGLLNEAEDLLESMPSLSSIVGWTSLLDHCKTYGNLEVGRQCFENFVTLDHGDATGYVLMSNMFCHAVMEENAEKVEELRKCVKALKKPGQALIEVHNEVHEFTVGESCHCQSDDVHSKLQRLSAKMKEKGYMPSVDSVLQSISDEKKEDELISNVFCEPEELSTFLSRLKLMKEGRPVNKTIHM